MRAQAGLWRHADRLIVLAGLGATIAIAWWYLVAMAEMATDAMAPTAGPWSSGYFMLMLLMWVVMMTGMMLPSALPVILLYARVATQGYGARPHPLARSYSFAAGYLLAWTAFSLAATVLQWLLDRQGLLTAQMGVSHATLAALSLVLAGVYQLTPLKDTCLRNCRGPVDFLTQHYRPGVVGALCMGWGHGLYCVGCCWALMLLLFAAGVMNLLCITAITLFVLLEKVAGFGVAAGRLSGFGLVALGVVLLLRA
jgi:predicted metal-binding membrane protein